MENKNTIEVLNRLVTINNDRIEGYKKAAEETKDTEFETLFSRFISNSQNAKRDLVVEVKKLGGEEAEGTKASGKFFRAWMDVKSALTGKDREAILGSCEHGENQALDAYNDVLNNDINHLSDQQHSIVSGQKQLLMSDRDDIVTLKKAI
ncbi:ferritin-like domain-containing protein [Psychroflexus montanilacus]|uniref:ferritin-like domain-containing protein n=1 Tax=Psychroflexus montanilacus TaxID=2873598 RepID=UPI001CCFF6CF|nr:PA2169 family four-helix-bundle protein [Psychroflexus montanilacus]MBZ9650924.1 PA2169 family four-helix-bundle protein [Psychroflexus montanilacus]